MTITVKTVPVIGKVMDSRLYVSIAKESHESLSPLCGHAHNVHKRSGGVIVNRQGMQPFNPGKAVVVSPADFAPARNEAVNLLDLREPDGRVDVAQVITKADHRYVIEPLALVAITEFRFPVDA